MAAPDWRGGYWGWSIDRGAMGVADVLHPMYYLAMAQPKKPPLCFRPSEETLAAIDATAERLKVTRHAAILRLIANGLAVERGELVKKLRMPGPDGSPEAPEITSTPLPTKVHEGVAETRVYVDVPWAGDLTRKPYQKGTKR